MSDEEKPDDIEVEFIPIERRLRERRRSEGTEPPQGIPERRHERRREGDSEAPDHDSRDE